MNLIQTASTYLHAFLQLVYPAICPTCGDQVRRQEFVLCSSCTLALAFTNFHTLTQNPLHKKFWGRMELQHIDSLLFLEKGSKTQSLLYMLKYHDRQDIGQFLAMQTITRYLKHALPQEIDCILAVPLHRRKQKQRGYNQFHSFAKHLATAWDIPYYPTALIRMTHSPSQTGNSRIERWNNVCEAFKLDPNYELEHKHILLIDDVLTTGATLEACGQNILAKNNTKLSVLTMACKV